MAMALTADYVASEQRQLDWEAGMMGYRYGDCGVKSPKFDAFSAPGKSELVTTKSDAIAEDITHDKNKTSDAAVAASDTSDGSQDTSDTSDTSSNAASDAVAPPPQCGATSQQSDLRSVCFAPQLLSQQ